ncbi:cobalamin adenosyltransferase [Anaerocolumna cellulosilytica]|uniref:Cobalamin adenosyltransferase n=1 Tax=Anaerocolumna cellulosilytica TaxID=433286 RepID=A0A6S6R6R1_9FIRM|nr:ATP-binding protein [Anaerocolumna cellulosilytica]MBB5193809.1 ethanolamine utilization cobalamin adenosyltransferase [Anaerocolumna cellulosilytica]BCJ94975.1 cobalamin adenosyltransferase [Anaerocolumna cellulosilytica]
MKVITEAIVREELKGKEPEYYYVEEGELLSPAAREYLQQRRIKIGTKEEAQSFPQASEKAALREAPTKEVTVQVPKYTDYESGAFYMEKPEHMTQLTGNTLVPKNHLRIHFRGKLDTLQAMVILTQATLAEAEGNKKIIEDLNDIKNILMDIMRCDILEETLSEHTIIGLTHKELRERSHDPQKFFNIKQMTMPDYTMGKTYALLNRLRTAIRETEVSAADAFLMGAKCTRSDIIEEFNRLSSALHIMMCMYLAGLYR